MWLTILGRIGSARSWSSSRFVKCVCSWILGFFASLSISCLISDCFPVTDLSATVILFTKRLRLIRLTPTANSPYLTISTLRLMNQQVCNQMHWWRSTDRRSKAAPRACSLPSNSYFYGEVVRGTFSCQLLRWIPSQAPWFIRMGLRICDRLGKRHARKLHLVSECWYVMKTNADWQGLTRV